MGACVRYILLALGAAAAAMLFEPFFSEVLRSAGIDTARWVRPVMSMFAFVASSTWMNMLAISIVGAAIGAWAHYVASIFDKRRPSKSERLSYLAFDFDNLNGDLRGLITFWSSRRAPLGHWSGDIYGKLCALHADLNQIGIRIPEPSSIRSESNCVDRVERAIVFFSIMRAMAHKGHYDETRKMGKQFTSLFNSDFPATDNSKALN